MYFYPFIIDFELIDYFSPQLLRILVYLFIIYSARHFLPLVLIHYWHLLFSLL